MSTNPKRAFSLVELSIVLVILGLLIGGILAGQSLIQAAELRKASTDFTRYTTAIHSFRGKYMGLPGDITNATAFWGMAAGTAGNDATCYNAVVTDSSTCNGDGSGSINTATSEHFRAWKQLANAGLIEGSYTGIPSSGVYTNFGHFSASNNPTGLKNTFWGLLFMSPSSGNSAYFDGNYGNLFQLGGPRTATASNHDPKLLPDQAWSLDKKLDDGKPGTGKFRTRITGGGSNTTCTNAVDSTSLNADYDLANAAGTSLCTPLMIID